MPIRTFVKKFKTYVSELELYNKYLWVLYFFDKYLFDYRNGINTSTIVPKSNLNFDDDYANEHASRYRPSSVFMIKKTLDVILDLEPEITDSELIDYGCGSGRVLFVAEQCGFQDVTGIELSDDLVEWCEDNIRQYTPVNEGANIRVIHENARLFIPSENARVFFFYRPFRGNIFREVLDNINKSVSEKKRNGVSHPASLRLQH